MKAAPGKMKIAVIGADGQLGSDVAAAARAGGHEVIPLTLPQMDIADPGQVQRTLAAIPADVIVNTAAMHQVEKCEADPARAFAVNALGARNLAQAANVAGARLVHISTDYVFDGAKRAPYLESDCPQPLNVYGTSKLAGELFVRTVAEKYYVLRVSGLYGQNPCLEKGGLNFVDLMLKLSRERKEVRVVDDEVLTPTATVEVARQILHMLEAGAARRPLPRHRGRELLLVRVRRRDLPLEPQRGHFAQGRPRRIPSQSPAAQLFGAGERQPEKTGAERHVPLEGRPGRIPAREARHRLSSALQ